MNIKKNHIVEPQHGKNFLMDYHAPKDKKDLPLVIFTHGVKGFKDWGTWNLIGQRLAGEGFIFAKYNFSHNGTTLEKPDEFDDLESFGHNNYMLELSDLEAMITHCTTHPDIKALWDRRHISLIGHSRGGPISLVKAANDLRISHLITWASVHDFDYAWKNPTAMEDWKRNGVMYRVNSRTKVAMPIYYQFYDNYLENKDLLDTQKAANDLHKPWLILHGTGDVAVPYQSAIDLQDWSNNAELHPVEGANHTFGGVHPFDADQLPIHTEELIQKTILFLNTHITA